jgi:hypothetical protein
MDLSAVSIVTTEDDDVAALLAMVVVALVSWLVVMVAYVVALVVTWARAIQLYLMAALSPIPLALLGLDETGRWGSRYLRQFASVCLAGLIITLLLIAFPVVLGGLNAASAGTGTPVDSVVGGSATRSSTSPCASCSCSRSRRAGHGPGTPSAGSEQAPRGRPGRARRIGGRNGRREERPGGGLPARELRAGARIRYTDRRTGEEREFNQ